MQLMHLHRSHKQYSHAAVTIAPLVGISPKLLSLHMHAPALQKAQKYDPHHDYLSFKAADENGGNRMATVLMYLSVPEEGGETVFPKVGRHSKPKLAPDRQFAKNGHVHMPSWWLYAYWDAAKHTVVSVAIL